MSIERSKIGLIGGIAIAAGSAVGGGLYSTPAIAGALAGPALLILFPIALLAVLLLFPIYFTLQKTWAVSAAHYHYITRLLIPDNRMISQIIGWTVIWSSLLLGGFFFLQFMVVGGAEFLHAVFPTITTNVFTSSLLLINFAIVWFGLRTVGKAEIVVSILLLISVGVVVVLGIPNINTSNLTPFAPAGLGSTLSATALVYFLVSGALIIIDLSGGVRDAETSMSKILAAGVAADVVTGFLVAAVTVGVVSYTQLGGETVAFVAQRYLSGNLTLVTGIGALLAGITSNMASIPLFTRYAMAVSDDKILPDWVGRRNKYGEPTILLISMFSVSIIFVFVDVSINVVANGYSFVPILLTLLMSIIGIRLPTTHPEIFENDRVQSSSYLRPWIVRWSSLGAMVILVILFVYQILNQQTAFLYFLVALFTGLVIYAIRSQQIGVSTLLPDKDEAPALLD